MVYELKFPVSPLQAMIEGLGILLTKMTAPPPAPPMINMSPAGAPPGPLHGPLLYSAILCACRFVTQYGVHTGRVKGTCKSQLFQCLCKAL